MARNFDEAMNEPEFFSSRHIGLDDGQIKKVLKTLELVSLEDLATKLVPEQIRTRKLLQLGAAKSESHALAELKK